MAEEKITFEEGIEELERIVHSLERGELDLNDSFKAFERAKLLEKKLRKMLADVDARILALTESGEEAIIEEDTKDE